MVHRILGPARQLWTGFKHGHESGSAGALAWRRRSSGSAARSGVWTATRAASSFCATTRYRRRDLAAVRSGLEAPTAIGGFLSWDEALSLISGDLPVVGSHFCLTFDDGARSWAEVALPTLTDMSILATFFVVTSLVGDPRRADALSWSSCQQLADQRMTVGSHTVSHRALADLDERAARSELRDSKRELEDRLGRQVADFCAPYGLPGVAYLPERDIALAKEEGYRSFATTVRGAMRHGDSPYQIRRLIMNPSWPPLAVLGRLHGGSPTVAGWS